MIDAFVSSWPLFKNTYLAGCAIALLLPLIGVVLVAREQVFVGAAVSQISALGIAVGMWLESVSGLTEANWYQVDAICSGLGGAFAIVGALVTANPGHRRESREVVTGWVYLVGASASVLLVAHSPHGLEEVHRLMTSTLIGATATDVAILLGLLIVMGSVVAMGISPLCLLILDGEMAQAVGLRVGLWNRALYIAIGLAIAICLQVSGMVYCLGLLVLPGVVAKNVCREVRAMFVVAPAVGVVVALAAFAVANFYDFPPAHVAVLLLAASTALSWIPRRLLLARSAANELRR